jgi:hypothetical protein
VPSVRKSGRSYERGSAAATPGSPRSSACVLQTCHHSFECSLRVLRQTDGSGQFSISPQATSRWKEQVPVRSHARRVHPGQAQFRVPTVACTRWTCSRQSRPWSTRAPQDLQGFAGQTHSFGMATAPLTAGGAQPLTSPLPAPAPNKDRYRPMHR